MIKKDIIFINGWPDSVRPLDRFLPKLKQRMILVCHSDIAGDFLENGWDCISVDEHSCEEYARAVVPLISQLPIRHVVADSELHLEPAAYLREILGVAGQSIVSARAFRNKGQMLGFVKRAKNFRVPDYIMLGHDDAGKIEIFCEKHDRIVVKPFEGTDSEGVRALTGRELLTEFSHRSNGYLAQEFIPYPVYHVDGLFVEGSVSFYSVCQYHNTCLEYSQGSVHGSIVVSDEQLIAKFGAAVREALALMPTPFNTTFHAEFFYDAETDDLVFCEIASRTGGGCGAIVALVEFEYGINLPREMILANVEDGYKPLTYSRRADGLRGGSLLIPKKSINNYSLVLREDFEYFLDAVGGERSTDGHFSTNDAVKIVFSSPIDEAETRRSELILLLTTECDDDNQITH